jgi:hypothetical protein
MSERTGQVFESARAARPEGHSPCPLRELSGWYYNWQRDRTVRRSTVPKVYGIREIELRPDADPNEYERFCRELMSADSSLDGLKVHLLRGDRGSRDGKFAWLFEIDSTDVRDRYFPAHDQLSDEMAQWFEQHPEAWAALQPGDFVEAENDTDYVDISD